MNIRKCKYKNWFGAGSVFQPQIQELNMAKSRGACTSVLLLTFLHLVLGEIHNFSDDDEPLKVIELPNGASFDHILHRYRRDAGSQSGDNAKLKVHETMLPDKQHNEAIVHWSGKNSNVSIILSLHSNC